MVCIANAGASRAWNETDVFVDPASVIHLSKGLCRREVR